jgi:2'-5' RNA ligase
MKTKIADENSKNLPYTLAFRLPAAFRDYFATCRQKLAEVCNSFEPAELSHLTVKFLGFSSEFLDEKKIIELLPLLYEMTRKYLPLKIYVRGFDTFTYASGRSTVVYLKVLPNEKLSALHHELCDRLPNLICSTR